MRSHGGRAPAGPALAVLAGLALLHGACAPRAVKLGVRDEASRDLLRAETIAFARRDGLYLSRGDGSGEAKIMAVERIGDEAAIFFPRLSPSGRRLAFLSLSDLDVYDSSGTQFALNIVGLKGREIFSWRRILLSKIAPPRADGRYEAGMAGALGWSADGARIALALNRPGGRSPLVVLLDVEGDPSLSIEVDRAVPVRLESLTWSPDGGWLLLGMLEQTEDARRAVAARLVLPAPGGAGGARIEEIGPGRYPSLSPDGRLIAVVEGDWDLVLRDVDGAESRRFVRPAGRAINRPFWSSGGRYLYYHSLASTGPLGLIEISMIRCLDIRDGTVWDLIRLG